MVVLLMLSGHDVIRCWKNGRPWSKKPYEGGVKDEAWLLCFNFLFDTTL
jgi:hypothetical protein